MDPTVKASSLRNLLVRLLLFGVFVVFLRFVYVVSSRCDNVSNFCFFSAAGAGSGSGTDLSLGGATSNPALLRLPDGLSSSSSNFQQRELWTSREWRKVIEFYSAVFQDLVAEGLLSTASKSLTVGSPFGHEAFALREIGVSDSIALSKKRSPPLVVGGNLSRMPFHDNSFDFIFSSRVDWVARFGEFAAEISRTLKPQGFLVVHTASAADLYSLNSFLDSFDCCRLVRSREIDGLDSPLREIVMVNAKNSILDPRHGQEQSPNAASAGNSTTNKCSVPEHKHKLIHNSESIIEQEPLKPWITLKRNINNIKYLPSMADISFRNRYVYIDVGARSYGSSIGSWFRKQYPKQNRTFEIYAIEADKAFHEEYKKKKNVKLLPYAAWIRNETLLFEINRGAGGHGMGRIRPGAAAVEEEKTAAPEVKRIDGFDFAEWLKSEVGEKDYVVMKMDVEGTEFELIPRLFETGAICLIDELFLECHYNRWQKCCPGERSSKYDKTYGQCLDLFTMLRNEGVLVHQWW